MFYVPGEAPATLDHDPFKAIVAPRPIGWISTIDRTGMHNLAPYSYFAPVSAKPPMVMFSSDGWKDTVTACAETGEFVVNLATWDLREAMNASSAPLARDRSEFPHAGVTPAPSRMVRAPRVLEAAAALECRVVELFSPRPLDGAACDNQIVVGQVVGIHIREDCLVDGRFDMVRAGTIARCGYMDYVRVAELFAMDRPGRPGG